MRWRIPLGLILVLLGLFGGCQTGYLGGSSEYEVPFSAQLLASTLQGRPGEVVEVPFRVIPYRMPGPDLIVCTEVSLPDGSPPPQIAPGTSGLICARLSGLQPTDMQRPIKVAPEAPPGSYGLVLRVLNEVSRHPLPFTLEVRP